MQCDKCGKTFRWESDYHRHQNRKTPCVAEQDDERKEHPCPFCAKVFTTYTSMRRHVRQSCSDDGRQARDQENPEGQQQNIATLQAKVDELTAVVHELSTKVVNQSLQLQPASNGDAKSSGPATQKTTVRTKAKARLLEIELEREEEHVVVVPWDDNNPIQITTAQIRQAFSENPMLQEYAGLRSPAEMTDPKKAPPYVLEALIDVIKRGHENPESHNVHLNPARADQVRVKVPEEGRDGWEVRELRVVARLLLEAASRAMKRSTLGGANMASLEQDVQEAVAWSWQLYEGAPEEYAQKAQKPLAAHLVNLTPQQPPPRPRRALDDG
jgi:uncharacterized C2H2 Zn-finger protein